MSVLIDKKKTINQKREHIRKILRFCIKKKKTRWKNVNYVSLSNKTLLILKSYQMVIVSKLVVNKAGNLASVQGFGVIVYVRVLSRD